MFDEIIDEESYWGEVVQIDDPKRSSRVRVKVKTVYDQIPVESMPWAIPRYLDGQSHDLPAIGDTVYIKFLNNDINFPTWYRIRMKDDLLSDDDYTSASVIIQKDLSKYDLDGSMSVRYTKSEGLLLELERDGNKSTIVIRNDNTVLLQNGQTGRIVHISNESISIGSETKSQQPSVVGDDNVKALNKLNDTIDQLVKMMTKNLNLLSKVARSSPYTMLLSSPLTKYAKEIELKIKQLHTENNKFFPETLSKISTIDKT